MEMIESLGFTVMHNFLGEKNEKMFVGNPLGNIGGFLLGVHSVAGTARNTDGWTDWTDFRSADA
jgi:hypothetical protein